MSYRLKDVPSYEETRKMLERVPSLEYRALFCLMYACGARVGETVQIRNQDCNAEDFQGKTVFLVKIFTEKNPKQKNRICPINCVKEFWLVKPIVDFLEHKGGVLFPYSTRWVNMLSHKLFGFNPHNLRHFRVTHLLADGWPEGKVIQYFGWSNSKPVQIYSHLRWKDLLTQVVGS